MPFNLRGATFLYLFQFQRYQLKQVGMELQLWPNFHLFRHWVNHVLITFWLISLQLEEIQKSDTPQIKGHDHTFKMVCLTSLYLFQFQRYTLGKSCRDFVNHPLGDFFFVSQIWRNFAYKVMFIRPHFKAMSLSSQFELKILRYLFI